MQANALLPHNNRADVHFGCRLDQMVDGIGKEIVYAFGLQDRGHGVGNFHHASKTGWEFG